MAFAHHAEGTGSGNGRSHEAWEVLLDEERRRLAMLWNAFEEAETRVQELEALLDRQRIAPAPAPPPRPAPVRTIEIQVPIATPLKREPRFPVDTHRVAKLPGMIAADAEKLRTYGVNLTDELLHIDLGKLAAATAIPQERLQRWRDMCELMALNGIGPTWAERLVDAGVDSIAAMVALEPAKLQAMLVESYKARGGKPQGLVLLERTLPARCRRLVEAARRAERAL